MFVIASTRMELFKMYISNCTRTICIGERAKTVPPTYFIIMQNVISVRATTLDPTTDNKTFANNHQYRRHKLFVINPLIFPDNVIANNFFHYEYVNTSKSLRAGRLDAILSAAFPPKHSTICKSENLNGCRVKPRVFDEAESCKVTSQPP